MGIWNKIWTEINILFSETLINRKPFYTELASLSITIKSLNRHKYRLQGLFPQQDTLSRNKFCHGRMHIEKRRRCLSPDDLFSSETNMRNCLFCLCHPSRCSRHHRSNLGFDPSLASSRSFNNSQHVGKERRLHKFSMTCTVS